MRISFRHPMLRYAAVGIGAVVLIILAVTPLVTTIVEGWSRRDVELRSRLVFRSIEDRVANAISVAGQSNLMPYLERLAEDGKLVALGFCDEAGKLQYSTRLIPKDLDCQTCRLKKTRASPAFEPTDTAIS
jgi:trehalose 6-phosphate synthase